VQIRILQMALEKTLSPGEVRQLAGEVAEQLTPSSPAGGFGAFFRHVRSVGRMRRIGKLNLRKKAEIRSS
jgi:hypothetical protein